MKRLSGVDQLPPEAFEQNGCCLVRRVLSDEVLQNCKNEIDRLLSTDHPGILKSQSSAYGIRNLLQLWPEVVELARIDVVRKFIERIVGPGAGIVRGLLFDKPPDRGWTLPWHRDRTVAIAGDFRTRSLPDGFSNLTIKAGVPHAIAPDWLLQRMITLRFSLDPMRSDNGPLVFVPGSHRLEEVETPEVSEQQCDVDLSRLSYCGADQPIVTQYCEAGDLFVMRPLLAHSSLNSAPDTTLGRRVVHLEICPKVTGVPWFDFREIFSCAELPEAN